MKIPEEHLHFVDRPEILETFIDSFRFASIDGTTFRMDLSVTRMDEPKPPAPPSGKKYPACRLVMPPGAMLEIYNNLHKFVDLLVQQGVLKRTDVTIPPGTQKH
jgi:hypothetical protein